jgi:hypothetical protein
MANRFAVASGNFNDTATWSTTAAGSPGASVPVAGDNAIANTRTIQITANATCDNITNGTAYGGTAGGNFILSNGVTLTANVVAGNATAVISLNSPNSASIIGNLTGGSAVSAFAVSTTGVLNITGNITGGNGSNASGLSVGASGSVSVSGNVTGGTGTNSSFPTYGIAVSSGSPASVSVTNGNVTGGSGVTAHGIQSLNSGSISVIGNIIGSSSSAGAGINNASNGSINVTGNVTGSNAAGIINTTTGPVTISGTLASSNLAHALTCTNQTSASVVISGSLISSSQGLLPTNCAKFAVNPTPADARVVFAKNGLNTYSNFYTADNSFGQAAITDVRSGTVYADGNLTGTCAVPAAGSVSLGVPVDAGFGTAVLTPAAIRAELATELGRIDATVSSRLAPSGTLATVTTLTNAPTVPTPSQIASQVRTELSSELAKVSALNPTRLSQVTTTEILGNLLSQANS